ncbi:MAG TPA: UvrD-helicase domain-containing protein [Anaerolineales bacterium]|nr:UvrD-helicase domain-containing protein [Anaerolineales bacterium]
MDLLQGLNEQQRRAVTEWEGPILVLAGPGSGKTRVLTHSIAYRISTLGARPFNILAVTFTNKAAREMEHRVEGLLGGAAQGLTLGTFHGICARILRREAERLPVDQNFVIFDADDQEKLVKQALKDLNIDEKKFNAGSVHGSISRAKNELITPDDFPIQTYRDEVVKRIYARYQEALIASNAVDFDDLLLQTVRILDEYPEVRQKYARRYEHILVDEFQDTNTAQYNMLKHLASAHRNIYVVGDEDQSIYRWRGADYRNVQRFEADFPGAKVIKLEQNYRSTQTILDVAMAVIDQNQGRHKKNLHTQRGTGQKITWHEAYNDHVAAEYVVDTIALTVSDKRATPGDFAIMYRTNAQSRVLEEAFLKGGLPYRLVGAQRFYGRKEVKDIIAYLRLIQNPSDEASLLRVINTPGRGIGDKTIASLRTLAGKVGLNPGNLLLELRHGTDSPHYAALAGRAAPTLAAFGEMLHRWLLRRDDATPLQLMDQVLHDLEYEAYLDTSTEEGMGRWENVQELRRLATEYTDRSLVDFLQDIALVSDQDTVASTNDAPTLLTFHAAKGLEFPTVFIVGLEDGTLPHIRSKEDPEAMAEERRLFYVGITRAKNQLYLVSAMNRTTYGYPEPTDPSPFMMDIPANLLNGGGSTRKKKAEIRPVVNEPTTWEKYQQRRSGSPVPVKSQYSAGMRVKHAAWGEGMVLNSRLQDGDETVDIFFENVGLKRVAASLANLVVVTK